LIKVYQLSTAAEIWNRLAEEFGTVSDLKYAKAETELRSLIKKPGTSMKDHVNEFTRLREARDFNAPANIPPLSVAQVNLAFLNSLGFGWNLFHQALGDNAYTMKSGELFARVEAMDSTTNTAFNSPTDSKALVTRIDSPNQARLRNEKKGKRSGKRFKPYPKKSNSNSESNANADNACKYCKQPSHTIENCYKKKWADSQWTVGGKKGSSASKSAEKPQDSTFDWQALVTHFTTSVNLTTTTSSDPYEWIVDSASNAHITPHKDRIENYRSLDRVGTVKGFGGKSVTAHGSGSVTLTDANNVRYTIKDVLYVPESTTSILSLMKLRRSGFNFHFLPDDQDDGDFLLSSNNSNFQLLGHAVDNILYVNERPQTLAVTRSGLKRKRTIPMSTENENFSTNRRPIKTQQAPTSPSPSSLRSCSPPELWHLTLIHASSTRLAKLSAIKSTFNSAECISCIRAKQHKLPFHSITSKATRKGEILHMDLAGPFPTSKGKSRYVMTCLDDLTHFAWVRLLPDKKSITVRNVLASLLRELHNQGVRVSFLRTDGGGEFEGQLTPLLQSLGIVHQTTAAYSPQSNGKAERLNRTLAESIRAMLFHANMPATFWAEAMATAVYTLNFLPSEAVNDRIP
jgi:Integrase core domain